MKTALVPLASTRPALTRPSRRQVCMTLAAAAAAASMPLLAQAQSDAFPVAGKPIRIVVPFPPGGQTDVQARMLAPLLGQALGGVNVVVENKPGGNMVIAAQEVIRAPADGHTLFYANAGAFTRNPFLISNLPYDPFRDFTPITQYVVARNILTANPNVPAKDLKEFVAWAKSAGRPIKYGVVGLGSNSQILMEILRGKTNIDLIPVMYKGTADAARDLMGGVIDIYIDGAQTAVQAAAVGRVKMLGITGDKRIDAAPDLPTFSEQGFAEMNIIGWIGFFGPAGLPAPITQRLQSEIAKLAANPEIAKSIRTGGNEPNGGSSEQLAKALRAEYDRMAVLFKSIDIPKSQ